MPVGPHVTDIVSFPLRVVIDLVPAEEVAAAVTMRADRRACLTGRGYRVFDVAMADGEGDIGKVLDGLATPLDVSPSMS